MPPEVNLHIEIDGIAVTVTRKRVKNFTIAIRPPDGTVRVSVPHQASREAIRQVIIDRLEWIKKHRERLALRAPLPPRRYETGEVHLLWGACYRLNVQLHDGRPRVALRHGTIELHVPPGSPATFREGLMTAWYRRQMKELVPELLSKWEPVIGVSVDSWGIKRMKTKWGTCNISKRRIWLNLELARKPLHCLEYIIVHELTHLLERLHNDRFTSLMDGFLPQWRHHKNELNHNHH